MNNAQKEVQQSQLNDEKRILRQLKLVYGQAQEDCINKIIDLSRRKDMENLQSIIYQKQYQEALKKQLDGILDSLQSEEFTSIAEYLQKSYHNGFTGVMYDLQQQGIPIIMPINQEQVVKALEVDSKLSKTLYSRLGEDVSYLKKSIRAELSRGIANGSTWNEMAGKVAKGMNSPFKKSFNNAIRIVRTEGHRIQQQSALDAQYHAKEAGADIVKQWDSTMDNRTRPHHRLLDGQIRELDEDFEVDGMTAKAPGYFGRAKEDINCRCCLLQRAKWALDEDELKELQERAAYFGLDKSKDFEEFKKNYLKLPENVDTIEVKHSPIKLDDGDEVNKYFYDSDSFKQWDESIDDSQRKDINDYTYTDYQRINYYLRTDDKNDENVKLDERLYGSKRKNQIKNIDKAISNFKLEDDIIVYRNVDASMFIEYFDDTSALIGKEIIEKGYSSSSLIKQGVVENKDCKMEILIPAGEGRGAYINSLSHFEDKEYEFLIARDAKFKITEVTETEEDLLLKMEMIVDE